MIPTEPTAVSGTRRAIKELVDGTLRVQIDIDPPHKEAFLKLFPTIDAPVALAPLADDFERKEKPVGGPLSKSAAQMCDLPEFMDFLADSYSEYWSARHGHPAATLRDICKIDSRAYLDHNPEAAKRFHELMREYREWNEGKSAP